MFNLNKFTSPNIPTPKILLVIIILVINILVFALVWCDVYYELTLNDYSIASSPLSS